MSKKYINSKFWVITIVALQVQVEVVMGQKIIPSDRIKSANVSNNVLLPQDTIAQIMQLGKSASGDTAHYKTINAFLKKGKFTGQLRSYFMATDNTADYPDYYAMALGTGLGYESAKFHGLQVGVSGSFIFNVWSNTLGPDPETGLSSRYEIGLFDMLHPNDKRELGRLETLYLRYNYKKSTATVGRQKITTTFINPQDGRMRPTLVNALWLETKETEKLTLLGGWIFGMGPRSTQDWFRVEESIGSSPVGRSVFGGPSQFKGNISSAGMAVAGITYQPSKNLKTSLWHYYTDNLFNLTFSQTDVAIPVTQSKQQTIVLGFQVGYQAATGNGGNTDQLKAYMPRGSETWLISSKLGYKTPRIETSLNYTRIADQGRFLFPREWGIEPFYTFLPRERLEGASGVHSFAFITDIKFSEQWKARAGYSLTEMPDVKDVLKNKYAIPSYGHLQLMTNYSFTGLLEGLNVQALFVYKNGWDETYNTPNFIVNKVDMSHYSLVMNYSF
ncbi:OprD family outer membrane porin [Pontibacter fetidus]|uniref:OprD family porin n=1 Tax=Pontibacter fetidus TaxID=2700082 RepID=A0A6B2GZZ8_9BACT|nr:OprD family outer membrane porin [Pontibacter fetidus]NDK55633.1 OprD family porin [Pontibacter fetidus]